MLPERCRELLTAYVDGELSARQRRALQKLLRRSAEARALLKRMQDDSAELRALPSARLEQDLSDSVLTLIAQRQIQPPRPRAKPLSAPVRAAFWPHLAAAAAVLLAVGVGSFLFFVFSFEPAKPLGNIAKDEGKVTPTDETPSELVKAPPPEQPKTQDKPAVPPAVVRTNPEQPKPIDEPLTAPSKSMEIFFKRADVDLPVVVKLHELEQEAKRKTLLEGLQKATAFRLEIPSSNGSKALEHLQAACKAPNINIGLLIEREALNRFQKPVLKTNYVIYLEDITPQELTNCLRRAAVEDNKPDAKKQRHPQLDSLVMTRMTKEDHEQLSDLLGVDPSVIKGKAAHGKPGSEKAADKTAVGQGGQSALVVSYNPVRPKPNSPDIKSWLGSRKPARPGTLQILLVLRTM